MARDSKIFAMIIDDNTERRKKMRGRLRKQGCRLVGFSGDSNLDDVKRVLPDIVFLSAATAYRLPYDIREAFPTEPPLVFYGDGEMPDRPQNRGKYLPVAFSDGQLKEIIHNSLSGNVKNGNLDEIVNVQLELIEEMKGLSKVSGTKYPEKIQQLCLILLDGLTANPKYKRQITDTYRKAFTFAAALHDIGMIGIDLAIINKAEPLTSDEFQIIKSHTESGNKILSLAKQVKTSRKYLMVAGDIIRSHHERWDGQGYPDGLKGEDIPLCARIMAVADCYNALRQERPYRPKKDHEAARSIIVSDSGKQFDPDVVAALIQQEEEITNLYESMAYQIIR